MEWPTRIQRCRRPGLVLLPPHVDKRRVHEARRLPKQRIDLQAQLVKIHTEELERKETKINRQVVGVAKLKGSIYIDGSKLRHPQKSVRPRQEETSPALTNEYSTEHTKVG